MSLGEELASINKNGSMFAEWTDRDFWTMLWNINQQEQ